MVEAHIDEILKQLRSRESHAAWAAFIDAYGPLIFQVIRRFETDTDDASDCFQFVCERLCENEFRRLQRFKPNGPAKFSTWLRAVTRNLCIDWRRKQVGRKRTFRSIARLSDLDREIFHLVYERRVSEEEVLVSLTPRFPQLTEALVSEAIERINSCLSTNQNWLLQTRSGATPRPTEPLQDNESTNLVDSGPSPEALAISAERCKMLNRALRGLSTRERLLIKLRFEEDLTLEQIARLLELGNAQRVDRQIKQIVSSLRLELDSTEARTERGKISTSSVKAH